MLRENYVVFAFANNDGTNNHKIKEFVSHYAI